MVLDNPKQMEIIIERDDKKHCNLLVPDLENARICLSESTVGDIEEFFNRVFKWVIENNELISFYTTDDENDLYNEVAKEIIVQLNNEINQSMNDFDSIIEVLGKNNFDINEDFDGGDIDG